MCASFNAGVRQSTAKMGPSQMRDELKRNNSDRFSIPSFLELRSAITTLGNKSRRTQGGEVPLCRNGERCPGDVPVVQAHLLAVRHVVRHSQSVITVSQ